MNFIRTTIFVIVATLSTVAIFLLFFWIFPLKMTGLCRKLSRFWNKMIITFGKYICGVDYQVTGEENIPQDGLFFVVSKHSSAWETFFLMAYFKNATFILKKELFLIPIFGYFLKLCGMIGIDRKKGTKSIIEVLDGIKKINSGQILIFPQGTRVVHDKNYSLEKFPYKRGIMAFAKELHCQALPLSHNACVFWGRGFASIKKSGKILLQFHKPVFQIENADVFDGVCNTIESCSLQKMDNPC
jgi:1-acyl-sn-glycerol-3-phosphate acyltransferase